MCNSTCKVLLRMNVGVLSLYLYSKEVGMISKSMLCMMVRRKRDQTSEEAISFRNLSKTTISTEPVAGKEAKLPVFLLGLERAGK